MRNLEGGHMENRLWKQLLNNDSLLSGWHLARREAYLDSLEENNLLNAFADDLDNNIKEIRRRLQSETYRPYALRRIDLPKGNLSVRPGSVVAIPDKVVLLSIIRLVAPILDEKLSQAVYSYRIKKNYDQSSMFLETDDIDFPFLKKKFISSKIDPFEPWYGAWPIFDEASRHAFLSEGYKYLAVSDISAYFENIQLGFLKESLLRHLPHEPKIVNTLMSFLEFWTVKTDSGTKELRGIPQGTVISSVLGNIFLLPLDNKIQELAKEVGNIRYLRYMDDVRIFCKDMKDARKAIFTMDTTIRSMHLNVQTAKTIILSEYEGEISNYLIDKRIDALSTICDEVKDHISKKTLTQKLSSRYIHRLSDIARMEAGFGEQKIIGSKKPLAGLSLRAFRRWTTAHMYLDSSIYISRLLSEIKRNPDSRLTKRLISTAIRFPRKSIIISRMMEFLKSEYNIFPYQEAEIIRSFRYMSQIPKEVSDYCYNKLMKGSTHFYIRIQCAFLLNRVVMPHKRLRRIEIILPRVVNPHVQIAMYSLLMQYNGEKNAELVRSMLFHPNDHIRNVGRYYRNIKYNIESSETLIKHIFDKDHPQRLSDNMHKIFIMSSSKVKEIKSLLLKQLRTGRVSCQIVGLRSTLSVVYKKLIEEIEEATL